MGTRGAYGFRIDGVDKVTYNHFDSYPSGLGKAIVKFCVETKAIDLKPFARGIRMVDRHDWDDKPTPEEVKRYSEFFDGEVGSQREDDWYCLLRESQGDLRPYLNGLDVMIDSKGFLKDSLFCEWAYIINLDDGVLEIYEGFNKQAGGAGRYAGGEPDDGYYGVKLVKTVPLNEVETFDMNSVEKI